MINQRLEDNGDLRRYRIELPNMTDDDLDPFQFRLYAHYKRVCGGGVNGGECFEKVTTTAQRCQMSRDKVIEARDWLAANGWIDIVADKKHILHIRIIDRWPENMARYSSRNIDRSRNIDFASHELAVDISTQRSNYTKKELNNNLLTTSVDAPDHNGETTSSLNKEVVVLGEAPSKKVPPKKVSPSAVASPAWEMYMAKIAKYEGNTAINFGRERKGINQLVALGWTAEQIGECFEKMKAETFWSKKHLSAQSLGQQIGALLNGSKASPKAHSLNGFQGWLQDQYGVTDLETAAMIAGKTEQELQDDYQLYA